MGDENKNYNQRTYADEEIVEIDIFMGIHDRGYKYPRKF